MNRLTSVFGLLVTVFGSAAFAAAQSPYYGNSCRSPYPPMQTYASGYPTPGYNSWSQPVMPPPAASPYIAPYPTAYQGNYGWPNSTTINYYPSAPTFPAYPAPNYGPNYPSRPSYPEHHHPWHLGHYLFGT
ncbi:MAG: hypothetical protein U0892_21430 [Pirellulales bacterium]